MGRCRGTLRQDPKKGDPGVEHREVEENPIVSDRGATEGVEALPVSV